MTPLQCEVFNVVSIRSKEWTAESVLKHMESMRTDSEIVTTIRQVQEALKFLFESGKATRKRGEDKRVWVYSAVVDDVILDKPIKPHSFWFWAVLTLGPALLAYISGRMAG